jgi:beta-galactosidase
VERSQMRWVVITGSGVDSRYYVGSGIYRHVWLDATEKLHVARHGLCVTTPEVTSERSRVAIQTRVQNETAASAEVEPVTELVGPNQKTAQQVTSKETIPARGERLFTQNADISSPKLWSPATPAFYRAVTAIRGTGKMVDRLEMPFGIRSLQFDAEKGFFLNGQPMKPSR